MNRLSLAVFTGIHLIVLLFIAFKVTSTFSSIENQRVEKINQLYEYLER